MLTLKKKKITTTVEYDALQRPVKVTYASGAEETASYDMSMPSMTITDKRGNVQKKRFMRNRRNQRIKGALTHEVIWREQRQLIELLQQGIHQL